MSTLSARQYSSAWVSARVNTLSPPTLTASTAPPPRFTTFAWSLVDREGGTTPAEVYFNKNDPEPIGPIAFTVPRFEPEPGKYTCVLTSKGDANIKVSLDGKVVASLRSLSGEQGHDPIRLAPASAGTHSLSIGVKSLEKTDKAQYFVKAQLLWNGKVVGESEKWFSNNSTTLAPLAFQ